MHIGYFAILDDVGGEYVDDEYHDEDEGLDVEGLRAHFLNILWVK